MSDSGFNRTGTVLRNFEEAAQQLWQLWRRGEHPAIAPFLSQCGNLSGAELAAVLWVDQKERWLIGERPSAEMYLSDHPSLIDDPEAALELIYGEFLLREQMGEAANIETFVQRFPTFADRLRQQVELHRMLPSGPWNDCGESGDSLERIEGRRSWSETRDDTLAVANPIDHGSRPKPELSGYEVIDELGRGGMGIVYLARHRKLKRLIALKMMRAGADADPSSLARFQREAEAMARLQHPNIVQVFEVGEEQGRVFVALEYLDGGSLEKQIRGTPRTARDSAEVISTLAKAVQHAHERGVIHRDLKPGNVLIQKPDSTDDSAVFSGRVESTDTPVDSTDTESSPLSLRRLKITDFGLAKQMALDTSQTHSGAILGTPSYMAPEQALGQSDTVGPAADIYALGAILYELLTGRPPFKAESTWETMEQVRKMDVVSPRRLNSGVPRDLEIVCLKCLAKEPRRRYSTAQSLAEDLDRWLEGRAILGRPTPVWEHVLKWSRRRPYAAASLVTALLAVLVMVVGWGVFTAKLRIARIDAESARDAARTNATIASANAEVAKNNATIADQQRNESERQLSRAERNSRWAMEVVDKLLSKVGDKSLSAVPEMENVRRDLLNDALEYCRKFLDDRDNPDPAARREVGLALQRLGRLFRLMGQLQDAIANLEEAIEIQQKLVDEFPDHLDYRSDLSRSLYLRYLSSNGDRSPSSRDPMQLLLTAVELREQIAEARPDNPTYRADLAKVLIALAPLYRSTQPAKAQEIYERAIDLLQTLCEEFPDKSEYADDASILYGNLSVLQWSRGEREESVTSSRLSVDHAKRAVAAEPRNPRYQSRLGIGYIRLAKAYSEMLRLDEASEAYDRMSEIYETLVREHPAIDEYQTSFAQLLVVQGVYFLDLDRGDDALRTVERAMRIYQDLIAARPNEKPYKSMYIQDLASYGSVLFAVERDEDARRTFQEVIDFFEPAMESGLSGGDAAKLIFSHLYIHRINQTPDDPAPAFDQVDRMTKFADEMAVRYPNDIDIQDARADAHLVRAQGLSSLGRYDGSMRDCEITESLNPSDAGVVARSRALNLVLQGDYAKAISILKPLEEVRFTRKSSHHLPITVYVEASKAVRQDGSLTAEMQQKQASEFEDQAARLLRLFFDRGDFRTRRAAIFLSHDPRLQEFWKRDDCRDILEKIRGESVRCSEVSRG